VSEAKEASRIVARMRRNHIATLSTRITPAVCRPIPPLCGNRASRGPSTSARLELHALSLFPSCSLPLLRRRLPPFLASAHRVRPSRRVQQRKAKKAREAQEAVRKAEETKRLKHLRRAEIEERLAAIARVSGGRRPHLPPSTSRWSSFFCLLLRCVRAGGNRRTD